MKILSVNTARVGRLHIQGRSVATAIGKRPVDGPVAVLPLGLDGDEQADPTVHGGRNKAVYAYGAQHRAFWQTVRAQARAAAPDEVLPHGFMGENLSIDQLDEAQCFVGDRWRLPGCTLVVTEPRQPCYKFNAVMGFNQAGKLMAQSGWCGSYLAVLEPGVVQAGDVIEVVPGAREVNIRELFLMKMKRRAG
ncbi:MAG: MOSC domain-containing protein [Burkholderiaceae bacterium]|nr:MOSC domain-containing protein [Burkholderiaceae bacterium]